MYADRPQAVAKAPLQRSKQVFADTLARARPRVAAPAVGPAGSTAAASRTAGHLATAQELQRARAVHATEAARLAESREDLSPQKLMQIIARELEIPAQPVAPAAPGQSTAAEPERAGPAPRVESALRLVERIAVFLRSGRPQLELSVGGPFSAVVLLERTGPREVAVTIRGRNGPPPPEELARVREGLRRRGLKLSSMTVR